MASDRFANKSSGLSDPADDAFAVTPDNTTNFDVVARALYVGTGGDVVAVTVGGTAVTLKNVVSGQIIPIRCKRVNATSTTATDIVGLV